MGDKVHNEIGDISNISGQVFVGKFNNVIANLNATNQKELAETLKTLQEAVTVSECLNDDEKQDHLDVITEIGEQASSPKPNKAKLKRLSDGLITALRTIPDVAKTVTAMIPVLTQLHLINEPH